MRQNEKKPKYVSKKFVKVTIKRKVYTVFQTQRGDFKIKNKDKKYLIILLFLKEAMEENGCYGEWWCENTMQLLWLLLFMEQLFVTNIKVAKQLTQQAIFKFCGPTQKIYLQTFHRFGFHTVREVISASLGVNLRNSIPEDT